MSRVPTLIYCLKSRRNETITSQNKGKLISVVYLKHNHLSRKDLRPIHHPSYVALKHRRTLSPECAGAQVYCNRTVCLTAIGASSADKDKPSASRQPTRADATSSNVGTHLCGNGEDHRPVPASVRYHTRNKSRLSTGLSNNLRGECATARTRVHTCTHASVHPSIHPFSLPFNQAKK
jgi:hypothetical protein